ANDNGNPITDLVQKMRPPLEEGAQSSPVNNFQGRYAVRHEWTGPIKCDKPMRYRWGGPPQEIMAQPGFVPTGVKPALDLAFAPRDAVKLTEVVQRDVPEIDLKASAAAVIATPVDPKDFGKATPVPSDPKAPPVTPTTTETKKSGCGCASGTDPGGVAAILLAGLVALRRRRQRGVN
nr:MYXO-CTERM sorting domain-containing protein [Deltaproteobacteria bacterium]